MAGSTSLGPKFSKKQIGILHALCHADETQRRALLRTADKALIRCICEIALNTLHGTIPISAAAKRRLRKHKNVLRKLVVDKKSGVRDVWRKKRSTILQHGGGAFLPLLITPIIGALASSVFSALLKDGASP